VHVTGPEARGEKIATGLNVFVAPQEIECLREYWQEHTQAPEITWDVYWSIIRERKTSLSPFVVGLFNGLGPDGILVGRIEQGWVAVRLGYLPPIRISVRKIIVSSYGLVAGEAERVAPMMVSEVNKWLREGRADVAVFEDVETGSALHRAAVEAPIGFLMKNDVRKRRIHWRLELPACFEDFQHAHRGLMQKVRKLERAYDGRLQYRRFRLDKDIEEFCDTVEDVAKSTYQRALRVGFLNSREDRALLSAAAGQGAWEAFIAYIDGCPVAFWSGIRTDGTFVLNWTGYDAAYENYSPGLVAIVRMLEALMAEGIRIVDFGVGDWAYKKRLSSTSLWEESVLVYAPTLKGLIAYAMRRFDGRIANINWTQLKKVAGRLKIAWRIDKPFGRNVGKVERNQARAGAMTKREA
jgi:hypothetical protein